MQWTSKAWSLPGIVGGIILAAAGVSPDEAKSNLEHWAKVLHVDQALPFLGNAKADQIGIAVGSALILLTVGWWLWRRLRPPTDEANPGSWRHVQKLTLWQAAGLWAGETPIREVPEESPIYGTFRMLKDAAASGRLRVIKRETPISNSYVLQTELSRFAEDIGEKPKFPFAKAGSAQQPELSEEKIKAWDVIHRRWQLLDGGSPEYRLEEAVADFNKSAQDGAFSVWGRLDGNAQYERISPDFWITGGIDILASMKEAGDGGVAQSRVIAKDAKKYVGLMVVVGEIERAWPGTFTDNWREIEPWDYK